jgi:hypothetical protein
MPFSNDLRLNAGLSTLSDLENKISSADEYEVLLSAGLLRKLLMDDTPLMDQVNVTYRLKIRFPMNAESTYERMIHEDSPIFGHCKTELIRKV